MYRYFLIISLLINFLFSNRQDWSSTPIDHFFNANFNKMIFRNPIYLIPYDLKVGFFNYGGPGYYNQVRRGSFDLDSNPIFPPSLANRRVVLLGYWSCSHNPYL